MAAAAAAASICRRGRCRFSGGLSGRIWRRWFGSLTAASNTTTTTVPETKVKVLLPWLMLSSPSKPETRYLYHIADDSHNFSFTRHVSLPQIAGHNLIGSSQGFLLSLDPTAADLHATDPLTGSHLPLPPSSALPHVSGLIRSPSDRRILYYVRSDSPPLIQTSYLYPTRRRKTTSTRLVSLIPNPELLCISPMEDMRFHTFWRAILSPSLDTVVVVIESRESRQLAFAPVGGEAWTALDSPIPEGSFYDIIFHRGMLHAVNGDGTLAVFDLGSGGGTSCGGPVPVERLDFRWKRFLVESPDGNDLFFLIGGFDIDDDGCTGKYIRSFAVFKLDKSNYEWNQVESLGDLAMFVGFNHSFSLSARDFPNLVKSDCIYFTESDYYHNLQGVNLETGVFDLGDGTIKPFVNSFDGLQNWPSVIWFMPSIC